MRRVLFLFILFCNAAHAQQITPDVVNATGGAAVIGTTVVEWNVGESIVASMQANNGVSITSGQLQPTEIITAIRENEWIEVSVYPNPSRNELYIKAPQQVDAIRIYDATGRLIKEEKQINAFSIIDVGAFSAGIYQIVLLDSQRDIIYSQTISKVN